MPFWPEWLVALAALARQADPMASGRSILSAARPGRMQRIHADPRQRAADRDARGLRCSRCCPSSRSRPSCPLPLVSGPASHGRSPSWASAVLSTGIWVHFLVHATKRAHVPRLAPSPAARHTRLHSLPERGVYWFGTDDAASLMPSCETAPRREACCPVRRRPALLRARGDFRVQPGRCGVEEALDQDCRRMMPMADHNQQLSPGIEKNRNFHSTSAGKPRILDDSFRPLLGLRTGKRCLLVAEEPNPMACGGPACWPRR